MFKKGLGWLCALAISIGVLWSCSEDISDTIIVGENDINNADDAEDYLASVYRNLTARSLFSDAFLIMPLLFSDEAEYTGNQNSEWKEASNFDLTADNAVIGSMMTDFYSSSAALNILFNEIDTTDDASLTDDIKDGFRGEALAIRGMLYFYLNSFWGEVPLLLDPDGNEVDSLVMNGTAQEIFNQIESDLLFGAENISKNPSNTGNQRISEWTAMAFLARLYLYNEDWTKALRYAEDIINSNQFSLESDITDIYRLNSSEHIWILPDDQEDVLIATWFLQTFAGGQHVIQPRENDFFEAMDLRKSAALSAPGTTIVKYSDANSNADPLYMVRLGEVHLIAAEAAARLGQFETADEHINKIRNRAGLSDVAFNNSNIDSIILQERRAELCYEGPHRWFDLKRLGMAVDELGEYGYTSMDDVWPISTFFIDGFRNLVQNAGY